MAKIPKNTPEWFARSTALGDIVMAEHAYLIANDWKCEVRRGNVIQLRSAWPDGKMDVWWTHPVRARSPVREDEALRRQRAADRDEL